MEQFERLSSIGRALDPDFSTNRAITGLTVLAGLASAALRLLSGASLLESAIWGGVAGVSLFLGWALGREVDPDHDATAFLAGGLALVGVWTIGGPDLAALLWMITASRILNRTVGPPPTLIDAAGILFLAAWLGWRGAWVYLLLTSLAFLLDSLLTPRHRRSLLFAGLALPLALLFFLLGTEPRGPALGPLPLAAVALITAAFGAQILRTRELRSVADRTGEPLDPGRLRAARAFALLAALVQVALGGMGGLQALLPLWAVFLAAPALWAGRSLLRREA